MVKLVLSLLVVVALVACIWASPLPENEEAGLLRQKRVTCDVLSGEIAGVAVKDSACALHCLAIGKKGGSCQGGVCVCR